MGVFLSTLSSVETVLGEYGEGGGLNGTLDAFFEALQVLANHPSEQVWRHEAINAAEALAAVENRLRPELFRDGKWTLDYVRLRMLAVKEI